MKVTRETLRKDNRRFLQEAAQRIGQKFHPQKVILFGSYAYGHPDRESDVDFLVIFSDRQKSRKRYAEISKELEPRPFPVDLLIRSMKEIRYRLKIGDSFIQEIVNNGRVLYES